MKRLPEGTVTLVFTDVEGSTRLLEELGLSRYISALDAHRHILRDAVAEYDGVEIEMQGDSFHFAFAHARQAVMAAAVAQRALAEPGARSAPIRIRMGINTGTPVVDGRLYAGLDVHLAARVMAVAHGGQVLLSETTHSSVASELPSSLTLRAMGSHRLKDIGRAVRLYQLTGEGLEPDFAPLRSLHQARLRGLPEAVAPLLGRAEEVQALRQMLVAEDVRLVTITGPGGAGKTQLALTVASMSRQHVAWVPLAGISNPDLVVPEIARAVGVQEVEGMHLSASLAESFAEESLTILLDNVEHLIDCAPDISALFDAIPDLRVLATSREPLRIIGEQVFPIGPLQTPEPRRLGDLNHVSASPAVKLYVQRARESASDFQLTESNARTIGLICTRLDGLPLALELAAGRASVLTSDDLLSRLEQRLDLFAGGRRDSPQHHRTLRSAIEWSAALLEPDERRLLARLGVFSGGWTVGAAEEVCGEAEYGPEVVNGLVSLLAKNLIRREVTSSGAIRLTMLETIRQFATDELRNSGELLMMTRRHSAYFAVLAAEVPELAASDASATALTRFDDELDNFRAAIEAASGPGEVSAALEIATALGSGERARRLFDNEEAIVHFARARQSIRDEDGLVALQLAELHHFSGNYDEACRWYSEALDRRKSVSAWRGLAATFRKQGHYDSALNVLSEAFEEQGSGGSAPLWLERSWTLAVAGRPDEAREAALAGLAAPDSPEKVVAAQLLLQLAHIETVEGRGPEAVEHALEADRIVVSADDLRARPVVLRILGDAYRASGDLDAAQTSLERGLEVANEVGDTEEAAGCLLNLGLVLHAQGLSSEGINATRWSVEEFNRIAHASGRAQSYANLAWLLAETGEREEALSYCQLALELAGRIGHRTTLADTHDTLAAISLKDGDLTRAVSHAEEAADLYLATGAKPQAIGALHVAIRALESCGDVVRAREVRDLAARLESQSTSANETRSPQPGREVQTPTG